MKFLTGPLTFVRVSENEMYVGKIKELYGTKKNPLLSSYERIYGIKKVWMVVMKNFFQTETYSSIFIKHAGFSLGISINGCHKLKVPKFHGCQASVK